MPILFFLIKVSYLFDKKTYVYKTFLLLWFYVLWMEILIFIDKIIQKCYWRPCFLFFLHKLSQYVISWQTSSSILRLYTFLCMFYSGCPHPQFTNPKTCIRLRYIKYKYFLIGLNHKKCILSTNNFTVGYDQFHNQACE